jgi:hypothetical protein
MALEHTQPLTKMSTRNLPMEYSADLTTICEQIVYKTWDPREHTTILVSAAFF